MKPEMSFDFNSLEEFVIEKRGTGALSGKQNIYFAPFLTLLSHNCFPNADSRTYHNDTIWSQHMEGMVYALLPIQKGSKISITHAAPFYHMPKKQRQEQLKLSGIICDCLACGNNWPELLNPYIPKEIDIIYQSNLKRDTAREPFTTTMLWIDYVRKKCDGECDSKTFDELSKTITLAVTHPVNHGALEEFFKSSSRALDEDREELLRSS